jgi:Tol biopolymer transport system component
MRGLGVSGKAYRRWTGGQSFGEFITENPDHDVLPAWWHDGTRITFTSSHGGNQEAYVMNADCSEVISLTNNAAEDYSPARSRTP